MVRTVVSSRMVLTATHLSSASGEMVGFLRAGRMAMTASRFLRSTLRMRPTLPSAAMAPSSSILMSASFCDFQESAAAALLATNCVFEVKSSSTMRSLLARREEPVSVTSTMASARSGGLTSVAPQLNSTLALTPFLRRYFLVASTSSVAMILPSRSFTVLTGEDSGTASTQRTLPKLCLE